MPINQHIAEFLFLVMQHSNHDCPLYIDNDRIVPISLLRWHIRSAHDKPTPWHRHFCASGECTLAILALLLLAACTEASVPR
jgi:hypothetical protein